MSGFGPATHGEEEAARGICLGPKLYNTIWYLSSCTLSSVVVTALVAHHQFHSITFPEYAWANAIRSSRAHDYKDLFYGYLPVSDLRLHRSHANSELVYRADEHRCCFELKSKRRVCVFDSSWAVTHRELALCSR